MAKKKDHKLELKITFDTSSLYTGSEVYFLNKDVADAVREHSKHSEITVSWYCPDVVRHERQYQMQNRALELLPPINKLEKLLGHNLNITESIILRSVEEAIDDQLEELGIEKFGLEYSSVDWGSLVMNACYREPPFQVGEKEKGFREALIIETIMQLIGQSPKSRNVCRVVVVAGDKQLATAVRARSGGIRNVHVLETVEDLKGLINTLVSKVTEEYINSIKEKVLLCFFDAEKEDGVYFRAKVRSSITEKYKVALRELPEDATERTNHGWFIQAPNFVKKSGQRTFWNTRVRVEAEAFKWSEETILRPLGMGDSQLSGGVGLPLGDVTLKPLGAITLGDVTLPPTRGITSGNYGIYGINDYRLGFPSSVAEVKNVKRKVGSGNTIFDVLWSVLVTTRKELRNPKVEDIKLVGTYWS